jgi:hypothetical protein
MSLLLSSVTNKRNTVSTVWNKTQWKKNMFEWVLRQRFPKPLPFPLFLMEKLCLIYAFFYLRAHFQERKYRVNREVARPSSFAVKEITLLYFGEMEYLACVMT